MGGRRYAVVLQTSAPSLSPCLSHSASRRTGSSAPPLIKKQTAAAYFLGTRIPREMTFAQRGTLAQALQCVDFIAMKQLYNLIFLGMGAASQSCTYDTICLPKTPLTLTVVNSPYDDWNCGIPWEESTPGMAFLFSSNRTTQGKTFDLVTHNFWINVPTTWKL